MVDASKRVNYSYHMVEIRKTTLYVQWFESLRDR